MGRITPAGVSPASLAGTYVSSDDGENFTWNGEPVDLGGGGGGPGVVPSLDGEDVVLTIPAGAVWGIDLDGIPYYDPDGAAAGQEALLVVGTDGSTAVVTIGA